MEGTDSDVSGTAAPIENWRETSAEMRLVARFQHGDPDALGALYALHADRVYAYARHLTGSREDAEEITGAAFLRAFERAASFRGDCPFRGWLFGITRNLCLDRLRQPKLILLEPEDAERLHDDGRASAQMETAVMVRQALHELPEEYRLVLLLCDVEEWEAREVAAGLQKSLAATKSLLYRARRALRTRLTELWGEEENDTDAL